MKCKVISLENKSVGDVELDDAVFGAEVRADLLARAVNWQLAKRRAGNHKVKGRSEVSARKGKPFRQKGSGRARQGSTVAPSMRGGGVSHGPVVRSHAHALTKKVRKAALRSALSAKQAEGNLVVVDKAQLKEARTGDLAKKLSKLGWGKALVIDGATVDANFLRASGNIIGIDVIPSQGANVYDILKRDTLVLTMEAVEKLQERLK